MSAGARVGEREVTPNPPTPFHRLRGKGEKDGVTRLLIPGLLAGLKAIQSVDLIFSGTKNFLVRTRINHDMIRSVPSRTVA